MLFSFTFFIRNLVESPLIDLFELVIGIVFFYNGKFRR